MSQDNVQHGQSTADLLRGGGFILLFVHCYFYCYKAFVLWGVRSDMSDRFLAGFIRTGLFDQPLYSKGFALLLVSLSLMGSKGNKTLGISLRRAMVWLVAGLSLYMGSGGVFFMDIGMEAMAEIYMGASFAGLLATLLGGALLSRVIHARLHHNIFNTDKEEFPQEGRRVETRYSVQFRLRYQFKGSSRLGWINIVNPFRGMLVMGSPGSGKSWCIINSIIRQHIEKGFALLLYDYKAPDLTRLAYNWWLQYGSSYPRKTQFHVIDFGRPECSTRCNPIDPRYLTDILDAAESARAVLVNLNPGWVDKGDDFWVQSANAFLTALIWYLRKFEGGKYCTFPHVLELLNQDLDKLFSILRVEKDISTLLDPFLSGLLREVRDTVDNQLSSLKVAVGRMSSPVLYYLMSGGDLDLAINRPDAVKLLCLGNSPQRSGIYGAALSLYVTTINRVINKKGMHPCGCVYDELPTIRVQGLPELVATGRSNKLAITLCVQNLNQLRVGYGRNQADVVLHLPANIICGQVSGESAREVSERIGKIVQERTSLQIHQSDTSVSKSTQLEMAVPIARLAQFSSGEFAGIVADEPDHPLPLKAFHGHIVQDNKRLDREAAAFVDLPVIRRVDEKTLQAHAERIRKDVEELVVRELARMLSEPDLAPLIIRKK